jgi:hypothetical protein
MQSRGRRSLRFGLISSILLALPAAPAAYVLATSSAPPPGVEAAHPFRAALAAAPFDNQDHLYVLDGHGGVHPVGASPRLATFVTWPNKDVAYSLALFPDGTGGYVLNAWGGIDPVGMAPPIQSNAALTEFGIAREIVMAPWSWRLQPAGYLLDGHGGIHPFGGAPPVRGYSTWPGADMARGLVITSNSTPSTVMGYTLDEYGGIHQFGGAPPITGNAYWRGSDVARGLVLERRRSSATVAGYTLDAYGGVHPFGGAPPVTATASWAGQDMADSIVSWTAAPSGSPGGWVLDRHGAVHPYGSAPALATSAYWAGWDIARGLGSSGAGGGGSHERKILDPELLGDGWGKYFNQRDVRWAARPMGVSSYPTWEYGCLVTDLAMVYTHFGYTNVTPATIAATTAWFRGNGAMTNAALVSIPGHPALINRTPTGAWITAQLTLGRPVIVGMNLVGGGTHFVTLTGLDGASDYWANDPWDQNAIHVAFSGDWDDRGSIYEAIAFS